MERRLKFSEGPNARWSSEASICKGEIHPKVCKQPIQANLTDTALSLIPVHNHRMYIQGSVDLKLGWWMNLGARNTCYHCIPGVSLTADIQYQQKFGEQRRVQKTNCGPKTKKERQQDGNSEKAGRCPLCANHS